MVLSVFNHFANDYKIYHGKELEMLSSDIKQINNNLDDIYVDKLIGDFLHGCLRLLCESA